MEELDNTRYQQVFNIEEDETLLSRVEVVICILMQRGLFIAGFDGSKALLTIHYTGLSKSKQVWDLDFFEQLFANEQLLTMREKVKAVFISSDKNIIVPEDLYDESAAKKWLNRIHYVEQNELVTAYSLHSDKAKYVVATPVNITELVKINFKKANISPLPIYNFLGGRQQSLYLQCCISSEQVSATLHNYSQLMWHKVFTYTNAEDIAFEMKHLCMENNISPSKLNIVINAISAAEYDVINDLSQYYPGLKSGDGTTIQSRWQPAISLAKQLLGCV